MDRLKPGHTWNPSYPPESVYWDPDEQYCPEDKTLCEPSQQCLCCLANGCAE